MEDPSPTIEHLEAWARHAGNMLRSGYGQSHTIRPKGRANLVTEMDHRSENNLLQMIGRHLPGDAIITEESGSLAGSAEHCWYLDPLDGTTNYAHGLPFFSVSMGYAEHGQMKLA